MAKTGSQRYPGASTSYWYQDNYGGDPMEVNVVCLHTTEGTTLPSYRGGADAPNLTAVPDLGGKRLRWYQHFDIETSSRALQNLRGGVETNTLNVVQVELTGTCDLSTHRKWANKGYAHVYWPEAPEWALRDLARFLAWMHTTHGVPLAGPSKWPPYPKSYANGGGQRMTFSQWEAFKGVCGHMHVPENSHGDPGALDFPTLIKDARELAGSTQPAPSKPATTKPKYEPFPGTAFFRPGRRSPIVAAMHKQLVAVGCNRYQSTKNQDVIGSGDVASYEAWQRKCGFTGSAAKWPPGKTTWDKLHVPNV